MKTNHVPLLDKKNRNDKNLGIGLGVVYQVNKTMSIEGSYRYTDNDSRSALYDYDRHIVTLGCAWNF